MFEQCTPVMPYRPSFLLWLRILDLLHLRRDRRVSVYPLSLDDLNHADIQQILQSDRCEEFKLQMVRPSTDMKTWAGQVFSFYPLCVFASILFKVHNQLVSVMTFYVK